MKKVIVSIFVIILIVSAFTLSACGDKGGTYYPTNEEMRNNLERKGYTVEVYDNINDHEFFTAISMDYGGTMLKAVKGNEYVYFARINNANNCDGLYRILQNNCKNYNSLVKIQNDEKFGNIVYCGTTNAINAAGIKVVNVDATI